MCGIFGTITEADSADATPVEVALQTLRHRGPDAQGIRLVYGPRSVAVLGHARLRIIDLSEEADQPLPNEDDSVWVNYNGELYNHGELRSDLERAGHRFRSRSDTEVLVHLYEETAGEPERMLRRLRGMFAFALFDAPRNRLVLARDRLGIKPLYWTQSGSGIAFSSEARALVRAGFAAPDPDPASLVGYLSRGVVPGPHTIFAAVRELPPGSFLDWQGGRWRVQQWWRPEARPDPLVAGDAPRLLEAALADAVARHLVADRPVGIFLSGGTDSRAVATLAAQQGKVRGLTVTFPGASNDEGEAASAFARRLGAEHEVVPITGKEVAQALPEILQAMDQPTSDGVNTWLVSGAAHRAGLVVALSGVGGDELFGGYPTFRMVPKVALASAFLGALPAPFRNAAAASVAHQYPGGRLSRVLAAPTGYRGAYLAVRGLFGPGELGGVIHGPEKNGLRQAAGPDTVPADPRDRIALLEATHYLPDQLLRDTDQMSMAHSMEVRVPLLDDAVVRVALALPASVRNASGKALLAQASGIDATPVKRPFSLPFDLWLRGPLEQTVRGAMLSEALPFAELVPARLRRALWEGFLRRRVHWSRLWAVTVFRLWPEANGFRW
jgi:asparagine synthase (glutamine-hydrolysing)